MDYLHNQEFLQKAMALAEKGRGLVSPNPVVGALLVRSNKIIAQDWHRKFGAWHAEANLLRKFKSRILPDDILYVTLEPCRHSHKKTAPCTDLIVQKGIKNLVLGVFDRNPKVHGKGVKYLRKQGIAVKILEEENKNLPLVKALLWQNRFFFNWIRKKRPWITVKIVQSLDGRIVQKKGQTLLLSGKEALREVHQLRQQFDAILVGVGTVLTDNPRLTARDRHGQLFPIQPKVVILDACLSTPLQSHVVRPGTILFYSRKIRGKKTQITKLRNRGVALIPVSADKNKYLDLKSVLDELGSREISSVFVEGGPKVWSSFLKEGLADEILIFFSSKFLGGGVLSFEKLGWLRGKPVQFRSIKTLGQDILWQGVL